MDRLVIYVFGQFRLNTDTQLLSCVDSSIRLQPKIYRLLLFFLRNPGRLISKADLLNEVWQGRIVEDTSVRLAINSLRKALHDEIRAPRYILTSTKNGYQFLAEVKIVTEKNDAYLDSVLRFHETPQRQLPYPQSSRQIALTELVDAFRSVHGGQRKLVFLKGKQGRGKTRLIEEFLHEIAACDFDVLRSRCVFLGKAAEPFMPILEALERRCLKSGGDWLIERLFRVAPTWLYPLLGTLSEETLKSLCPKILHMTTGRMLREGADLFESLAENKPFIVIVDNSQWCDEFTLDLLNLLAFRCSPAKLLVVIGYRPDITSATAFINVMRQELEPRNLCFSLTLDDADAINSLESKIEPLNPREHSLQ
ncbi:MAG: winged helix-turn-helix domain-containing protein [Methylococcaceae bacterium]|nr:winged helix-turn-helix domain-containing protein [Methylococcaceae bacterium]